MTEQEDGIMKEGNDKKRTVRLTKRQMQAMETKNPLVEEIMRQLHLLTRKLPSIITSPLSLQRIIETIFLMNTTYQSGA